MGLSRNKVAVPEGAAGSPPFYGVLWAHGGAPIWGCFTAWLPGRVVSLAGWKRVKAPAPLVVWVGSGVVHAVGFPDRQAPLSGVVFRSRRPGRAPCGVGVWGGVVWWFENWRVDASMNGVPCGVCRVCSYC